MKGYVCKKARYARKKSQVDGVPSTKAFDDADRRFFTNPKGGAEPFILAKTDH
jgi:hypothetical protein